jgi:hypothetical protein
LNISIDGLIFANCLIIFILCLVLKGYIILADILLLNLHNVAWNIISRLLIIASIVSCRILLWRLITCTVTHYCLSCYLLSWISIILNGYWRLQCLINEWLVYTAIAYAWIVYWLINIGTVKNNTSTNIWLICTFITCTCILIWLIDTAVALKAIVIWLILANVSIRIKLNGTAIYISGIVI